MEDEYIEDADFYDGPDEGDARAGTDYPTWLLPRQETGDSIAGQPPVRPAIPRWMHVPADAPPPPERLLTAEEFMARNTLPRPE